MKSNLYSIFIFIIGLSCTYFVTKNIENLELGDQKQEVKVQSQAIAYTIQNEILHHGQQLSQLVQRWQSVEQINSNWQRDTESLLAFSPNTSNLRIYLLQNQPSLNIDKNLQFQLESDLLVLKQITHAFPLNEAEKNDLFQSEHQLLNNNIVIAYQYVPIFNLGELIGYLQATLNITQLLDKQIATFQITYPFSISDTGRTIYSVLPKNVIINDINQQFTIPVQGHDWKLMVWPLHQHHFYRYVALIGVILSILCAQLFYLIRINKIQKVKLTIQKKHLSAINKDFKASKSKLIQSNKLSSLGEIATGIAHEINQPLQVICIHADMCQESLQKQNYRLVDKSFRAIISQVERIEKIVKQVGSFGRDSGLDNYNKELPAAIFDNVIDIVINQYNQEGVELRQVLPPSLPTILCNKTQIEQVLVNLLINAKDAVEDCDEKIVFIKAHDKQGRLFIEVSDSGSGIEPSKLDDIFTPFYTTKALGKGTGLGLSISYSIIHQHKGEFLVSSEMGKGSTFTVILPLNS